MRLSAGQNEQEAKLEVLQAVVRLELTLLPVPIVEVWELIAEAVSSQTKGKQHAIC